MSPLAAYLRRIRALAREGAAPGHLLATVVAVLADERGAEVELHGHAVDGVPAAAVLPPASLRSPWLLGHAHEALLDPGRRRRDGAHYTPPAVARGLVSFAREGIAAGATTRCCDPAVGGGAFLLAAAEALAVEDADRARVVGECCYGIDVDPLAVQVTRAALELWAGERVPSLHDHLVVADALIDDRWSGAFDLVVGNPPFQNQLEAGTARSRDLVDALRSRLGPLVTGYVDTAALFLLRGLELAAPSGRIALIQPQSSLGARDAAALRRDLLDRATLRGVWFAPEAVFRAGVRVWAPVLDRAQAHDDRAPIARRAGADFAAAPPVRRTRSALAATWGPVVADLCGVPAVHLASRGRIGDLATATAGFRDQFYGLIGAVVDADDADTDLPRLVTSGLIDVLRCTWGQRAARFAGQRYERPVVRLEATTDTAGAWVRAQLRPKLMVATQTRVLEVAVDEVGVAVPSTPVIAVHPHEPSRLWHLAAALSAPPVTAYALTLAAGAALSTNAVKLAARQVLDLPLPSTGTAWDQGAAIARTVAGDTNTHLRHARLAELGAVMCEAYGVDPDPVLAWWLGRVPPSRTS
ncbi:MAG TPA: N-6 DNA methylase [Acidimicrobiales bacterium]|nr:N-6 DNA methylase [Acidimicrobiales bacterium]